MIKTRHNSPERRRLKQLETIGTLDAEAFEELTAKLHVETIPAGRRLFVQGHTDQWVFYLLQGKIRLNWGDGHSETIAADSAAADYPLANEQPRPATATTLEPIEFIRIDANLLEVLANEPVRRRVQVEEIREDDARISNRLFFALYSDYMQDTLKLPQLPEVALKVREAVQNPLCDIARVARIIQADPVLAGKLIRAANSPLYGVQSPITTCQHAVGYLGLKTTRDLITSYALRDLFHSHSALLNRRMQQLWQHSVMTASLCYVLAGMTPGLDPDRALLLGLLHDIGTLAVIGYAEQFPEMDNSDALLDESIHALRSQVGAMVLRQWQFGAETVEVAMEAENWQRDPASRADYADLLVIAQQIECRAAEELPTDALAQLPAYGKLARGKLDAELVAAILTEARDEVSSTFELLD